jgi:hypothetical protein
MELDGTPREGLGKHKIRKSPKGVFVAGGSNTVRPTLAAVTQTAARF